MKTNEKPTMKRNENLSAAALASLLLLMAMTPPVHAGGNQNVPTIEVGRLHLTDGVAATTVSSSLVKTCVAPGGVLQLEAPWTISDERSLELAHVRNAVFALSVFRLDNTPAGSSQQSVGWAVTPFQAQSADATILSVAIPGTATPTAYAVLLEAKFWDGAPVGEPKNGSHLTFGLVISCDKSPCIDDPIACVAGQADEITDPCSPLNLVSHINGASSGIPSSSDMYAKLTQILIRYAGPGGLVPQEVIPVYDIYVSWHLAPVSAGMTVPSQGYKIVEATHWTSTLYPGAVFDTKHTDTSMDKTCFKIGDLWGNTLTWDVDGGDYGWQSSSTCTWSVDAHMTISSNWELKVDNAGGLLGGVGGGTSLTFGGSYACTDATLFQSEDTIHTLSQPVVIPPTKGLAGLP
jgi:hypothetical protein